MRGNELADQLATDGMMEDKENIKPKVLMVSGWTRKSMRVPKGK